MIYSVVVKLDSKHEVLISKDHGHHVLGLFLSLLGGVDPGLAEKLHSMEGLKPFTVSTLQGKFDEMGDYIRIKAGATCWLRFTALEDIVFAVLMRGITKCKGTMRLNGADFMITDAVTHPDGSPWAGYSSFVELLDRASIKEELALRFLSPTVFRSTGKRNVTFPLPSLVFSSLLNKWNAFSETKIEPTLVDSIESKVMVSRYKLETTMLHFGDYQELGFTGFCEYLLESGIALDTLRILSALADFAFFCGTGAKTTMGMGQTRRIDRACSISNRTRSNAA